MKLRLSELRQIIRETIRQQSVVPGKWDPAFGEPVDMDDVALMATAGLADEFEDEFEDDFRLSREGHLDEAKRKKKKSKGRQGLWKNIQDKRARGESPAKPGEKGYPKTLDI